MSSLEDDARDADETRELTLESIRPVRDPTARRTLEQAHALVEGLARTLRDAATNDDAARLQRELEAIGVTQAEAEHVAAQALELIELMADRDRKADVFHAAVRAAGQGERAMGERLGAIVRELRQRLGSTSPLLANFGVPPDAAEEPKLRPRSVPAPGPLWSAATPK
jgi:uncharacterized protein (DUF2342 family)